MNLISCIINALSVSRECSGLECLIVSDGQGQKLQFAIFDFRFKFYLDL